MRIFAGFLDVEDADRLAPFKSETPKSRENSRFLAGLDYTRHPSLLKAFHLYKHNFKGKSYRYLKNCFFALAVQALLFAIAQKVTKKTMIF